MRPRTPDSVGLLGHERHTEVRQTSACLHDGGLERAELAGDLDGPNAARPGRLGWVRCRRLLDRLHAAWPGRLGWRCRGCLLQGLQRLLSLRGQRPLRLQLLLWLRLLPVLQHLPLGLW